MLAGIAVNNPLEDSLIASRTSLLTCYHQHAGDAGDAGGSRHAAGRQAARQPGSRQARGTRQAGKQAGRQAGRQAGAPMCLRISGLRLV